MTSKAKRDIHRIVQECGYHFIPGQFRILLAAMTAGRAARMLGQTRAARLLGHSEFACPPHLDRATSLFWQSGWTKEDQARRRTTRG